MNEKENKQIETKYMNQFNGYYKGYCDFPEPDDYIEEVKFEDDPYSRENHF